MIEFFFDCSSPWTYLGFHNIQPLAAELKVPIRWRPILVGGVFNSVNPSVYASREKPVPAKRDYMLKDLQDWARLQRPEDRHAAEGVPGEQRQGHARLPVAGTAGPAGALCHGGVRGLLGPRRGHLAGRRAGRHLQALRHRAAAFLAGIAKDDVKEQLKANTDELIRRGGFGSPTIYVNGDDMYFGNDRLPLVAEALRRRAAN